MLDVLHGRLDIFLVSQQQISVGSPFQTHRRLAL